MEVKGTGPGARVPAEATLSSSVALREGSSLWASLSWSNRRKVIAPASWSGLEECREVWKGEDSEAYPTHSPSSPIRGKTS